jgi:hypothetical protein
MSDKKIAGESDIIAGWTEEEIDAMELSFLHKMFSCSDPEASTVTVAYALYMSKVQLDSDNYPIFLKLLQFENHWVVDALLGDKDPESFFRPVQPNTFILSSVFRMFTRWKPGGIYPKALLVMIGLLKQAYENPLEGMRMYKINIPDINNLGKHLDKEKDQRDSVNRSLLELLDRIASLNDPGGIQPADKETQDVSTQANNIRGKFLDYTKSLAEAIPDNMLIQQDYKEKEIKPLFTVKQD